MSTSQLLPQKNESVELGLHQRQERKGSCCLHNKRSSLETSERVSTQHNTNPLVTREIEERGSKLGVAVERDRCSRIRMLACYEISEVGSSVVLKGDIKKYVQTPQ